MSGASLTSRYGHRQLLPCTQTVSSVGSFPAQALDIDFFVSPSPSPSPLTTFFHTCSKGGMKLRKDKACQPRENNSSLSHLQMRGRILKSICSHLLAELKGDSIWNVKVAVFHTHLCSCDLHNPFQFPYCRL